MKKKKLNKFCIAASVILLAGLISSCAFKPESNETVQPESTEIIQPESTDSTETLSIPEQMTSSTEDKLVESIDLRGSALMILSDPGYTSTQGMCVIEDRYVAVGRYKSDGSKDIMVFDLIEKRVKRSNTFRQLDSFTPNYGTCVDLDHVNSLAYHDGFLYVPRTSSNRDILRLRVNEDCSIGFDSVAYAAPEGGSKPTNIACHDGVYYWLASGGSNGKFYVYRTADFKNIELAFGSDFGGLVKADAIVKQGMAYDGEYLYFAFTGRLNVPELQDVQRTMRDTEKIIITRTDGTIVRVLDFSRGSYGEIEEIDTATIDGNKFLLISCNRNDSNVSCVYAVPLYKDTVPSPVLEAANVDGSFFFDHRDYTVYCDNEGCYKDGIYDPLESRPFASGLEQDPFSSVYAALNQVKRCGCPATLIVRGAYGNLSFQNLPSGITFVFENSSISSLTFSQCPGVTVSGKKDAVIGRIKAVKSVVLAAPGIKLRSEGIGDNTSVEAENSIFVGAFDEISGFAEPIKEQQSLVLVYGPDGEVFGSATAQEHSLDALLQNDYTNDITDIIVTEFLSCENQQLIIKQGNYVMLGLVLGNGTKLTNSTGNDLAGTLPMAYWPAMDVNVPAVAAENSDGSGSVCICMVHIDPNGEISVIGSKDQISKANYIIATATYLSS